MARADRTRCPARRPIALDAGDLSVPSVSANHPGIRTSRAECDHGRTYRIGSADVDVRRHQSTVVAGTLNCLARLFRFAIKLGDLSASPMSAVERARAGVERVTPTLMVEEVDRLAGACDW
jgi:hypothetical protein